MTETAMTETAMTETAMTVAIYGAGAWGTALAQVAAHAGHKVVIIGRSAVQCDEINDTRQNPRLPSIFLHSNIIATTDPLALTHVHVILLAVPAQSTRVTRGEVGHLINHRTPIVACAKGIERSTGLLLSEVMEEALPDNPLAVLSGPGFAGEVGRGLPAAVTIAARDMSLAEEIAHLIATPAFRPYASNDPIGAQLGGALKNVLAIAAGVVDGKGLGASAEAAVITRGFVEMRRLAAAMGGKTETLMGLSGFGDVMLTCRSVQSRNFAYGRAIGLGQGIETGGIVVEGAATAAIAVTKARAFDLDVPIMSAVASIVEGQQTVEEALQALLARPLKREDHQ